MTHTYDIRTSSTSRVSSRGVLVPTIVIHTQKDVGKTRLGGVIVAKVP